MDWLRRVVEGFRQGSADDVPEVEVTDSRTQDRSLVRVDSPERPLEGRRSAAKNLSAPKYQAAFIEEARAVMGQPSVEMAQRLLGERVRLVFNVDKPSVEGVLTHVVSHPAGPYLMLDDNDGKVRYPLNAIQAIQRV
jgi:hypothetical protein